MTAQTPCLYCGSLDSSVEHVISEALGCKETAGNGVCGACNSTFGHTFEAAFVNGLALFLNFFQVKNRQRTVPSVRMTAKLDSREFRFEITGDGRAHCPPQLLARSQGAAEKPDRKFRLFNREQEQRIGNDLRAKDPAVKWERIREQKTKVVFDAQPDFDALTLWDSGAARTVAKYALNLLVYQYGQKWAEEKCGQLISLVKGEQSSARSGIFWQPEMLRRFPFAPPKHLLVTVCNGRSHSIAVFLYLFCLLPFCVFLESTNISVDSMNSLALDPNVGKFTPLFLGGSATMLGRPDLAPFPMPEFEFSDLLRRVEIGTAKQANGAAANALRFMKECSNGSQERHICYNCKKILDQLTPVCGFCGMSPLPEEL